MSTPLPQVDGLEINRILARGGSASVYEADDRRHARKVAVKVLDRRDFEESKRRAFRRELEAMGRLDDHPNVLNVFASGFTEDGSPYLVMPLISTGTVADRIARGEHVPIDEVLATGVKIGSALETAHERGILHCDIKPSNLFIGAFGEPLLGDLGISSVSNSDVSQTNRVSITLRYAAPEVIEGDEHTASSDIYSLGATLYEMIELSPPFNEQSKAALTNTIVSATEPPTLHRDVPPELAALIGDMMAADPAHRPASALDVVERFQAIERSLGRTATPALIADSTDDDFTTETFAADAAATPVAASSPLVTRTAALVAAALAVVVGIALWWVVRDSSSVANSPVAAAAPIVATAEPEPTAAPTTAPEPTTAPTTAPEPTTAPTTAPEPTTAPTTAPETETAPPLATDSDEVAGLTTEPSIVGTVTGSGIAHARAFKIDLFAASAANPQIRGEFIETVEADAAGEFGFAVPPGCYVLTFIAPEGSIVDAAGRFSERPICTDGSQDPTVVNAVGSDAPVFDSEISGLVQSAALGLGVAEIHIDIFTSVGQGNRDTYVVSARSAADGSYSFSLSAGCYVVTLLAPEGRTLVGGSNYLNSPELCVQAGSPAIFNAELTG